MSSKDIQQQKKYKILLIGELCQDVYVFGKVDRISPEAPVPIIKKTRKEFKEGMSGNVFKNIIQMMPGIEVTLHQNEMHNIKKIRFIDEKSNYQIMRYDIEKPIKSFNIKNIQNKEYDAIIISDYNKGFLTDTAIDYLTTSFDSKIFVDTKRKNLGNFKNSIIKLNENESKNSIHKHKSSKIITTLGQLGCMYEEKIYNTDTVEVYDVCGAGDVFLAALVVRWIETKDISCALKTANRCAALSVTKLGCYAISREEYENLRI